MVAISLSAYHTHLVTRPELTSLCKREETERKTAPNQVSFTELVTIVTESGLKFPPVQGYQTQNFSEPAS